MSARALACCLVGASMVAACEREVGTADVVVSVVAVADDGGATTAPHDATRAQAVVRGVSDASAPAEDDAPTLDAGTVSTMDVPAGAALTGVRLVALRTWTPLRRVPRRDGALAGYMRTGAVVEALEGPAGREGCPGDDPRGGWYRVRGDAWLCVGGTTATFFPARDFRTPAQPDLDASMPYRYAINYGRANMYRRIPTPAEVSQYEPWRARLDASTDDAPAQPEAGGGRDAARDVPRPTLEDLAGDPSSPVIRRMLTGMYVALDRSLRDSATGDRYWLTQSGGLIRDGRLSVLRDAPTFRGVELDATHALPMAWMVSEFGWRYAVTPEGRISRGTRVPRLTAVALSDAAPLTVGARVYLRTADGGAVLAANVRRTTTRAAPEGVGADERWIDVDLDEQVLVAWEGTRPVYTTLISSGRRTNRNAPERFETPTGSFRIQARHISTTMDGDTVTDGPYSIEDVPWVMYFQGSYALHAAFWHNYFGWRMSHGCVNLAPPDARWMFLWAEPRLPEGWHGVVADDAHPGSRVEIRHSRDNQNTEVGRPSTAENTTPAAPAVLTPPTP